MVNNMPSRRTVVAGAVAGGVALPVLAACGSSGATAKAGTKLGATSDIPVGGGKIFDDAQIVVTQPTRGDFKAFSAVCTHQGCLVSSVSDGEIHCPCHGSAFSATDGSVKVGPATQAMPSESITVKNGEITLA